MVKSYTILEKQRFLEILEPITAFHTNRNRHSEIYDIFRTIRIVALVRTKTGRRKTAKMDKLRLKVHKEVLKDVSAHFDGAEKIILEKIEEICTL